jgi:tetratricopeptide (TPR) repeat protein
MMLGRVSVLGVAIFAAVLAPVARAEAGGTGTGGTGPAVRVVAPTTASGAAVELDDLPEPQLEVTKQPSQVAPPAVPVFERTGEDNQLEIEAEVETGSPRLRKAVDQATLDASIDHLNACNRAIAARQYGAAITACQAATQVWPDNHLAWYALASAHLAKQEWLEASAAAERAVQLRPDRAMYQLYHGISLYERERQRVRGAQAPDGPGGRDHDVDPARLQLEAARDALALALKLVPALWRAHYYLGRVYRDLGHGRRAAREFTAAIKAHPGYRPSYLALSELYRSSDHLDQALAVATLGLAQVPAGDAAELWFEVGMVHGTRRADDQAIDAFGRVIAIRPGDAVAKLQRGQLYLRKGDAASAGRDLDDVMRSPDARVAADKPFIAKLLERIASSGASGERDTRWDCRRSGDLLRCEPRRR